MAQDRFLESVKNVKGLEFDSNPFLLRTKKIRITAPEDDSENSSSWSLPDRAVVYDVYLDVHTAEATGGTKTLDVGTLSTDSGDADGYLDGVSVSAAGVVKGTLVNTGQTLGTLLHVDESGAGVLVKEPDVSMGGKTITYTAGSADFEELVADIVILYAEI